MTDVQKAALEKNKPLGEILSQKTPSSINDSSVIETSASKKESTSPDVIPKISSDTKTQHQDVSAPAGSSVDDSSVVEKKKASLDERTVNHKVEEESSVNDCNSENSHDIKQSSETARLKVDRDNQEKAFKETKKWGHELSQKLTGFEKKVRAFIAEGALTDEEGKQLLDYTHMEDNSSIPESPLSLYSKIWDEELTNIRKYTDAPDLDQHILAFQHLLKNGDSQELENAFGQLEAIKDSPLKWTRKMLEIGKSYNEDVFHELAQAGSLKAFKESYEEKLQKQQKTIDKLEAKTLKLESQSDYIPSSSYSLPEGGYQEAHEMDVSINGILGKSKAGTL